MRLQDTWTPPFTPMVDLLTPAQDVLFSLERLTVSERGAALHNLRCARQPGGWAQTILPGEYMQLRTLDSDYRTVIWMSDTPSERYTNLEVVGRAHGRVLIAGLGLGMILVPILAKAEVQEVLVIEKEPRIIQLLLPQLLKALPLAQTTCRLWVEAADVFKWKPTSSTGQGLWNTIYFDIWKHVEVDNLPQMRALKRRFARRLDRSDPQAWMGCWEESTVREMKRLGL